MASAKKKGTVTRARKLKDLKAKTNPKGGASSQHGITVDKPTTKVQTGWIEIDSFSFGASNP
jgi:hypothetical protein